MPYVCLHAHLYQPSREDPWTGTWPLEPSACPWPDWNHRITAECYAPNAAARLLDDTGHTRGWRNTYVELSTDVGPTLLTWLEANAPAVYTAVLDADLRSAQRFGGHPSTMAQGYHHAILPLADDPDRRTEVLWGLRDAERRYGHRPDGFWMPETAVDTPTLETLAAAGVTYVLVAPHQVAEVRPPDRGWIAADEAEALSTRAYTVRLPSGATIVALPYDGDLARQVAFNGALRDGEAFGRQLVDRAVALGGDALVHLATDGESYGHHHRHGEMALARILEVIDGDDRVELTTYGAYLDRVPPTWEARLVERSSWSCAHGVERWSAACACRIHPDDPGHTLWRAPLRAAFDHLRDAAREALAPYAATLFRDAWEARDAYVDVVGADAAGFAAWYTDHAADGTADPAAAQAFLEIHRHLLAMYTSCGWFFDDVTGIEALQDLRHAAVATGLLRRHFGIDLSQALLHDVEVIPSNGPIDLALDVVQANLAPPADPRPRPRHHHRLGGLLCHVSSLPGDGPIGDTDAAYALVDWMADAGVTLWQVLPLSPTDDGGSPYASWSGLSGNPDLIGLGRLVMQGLLDADAVRPPEGPIGQVDPTLVATWKRPLLDAAADRFLAWDDHPDRARFDRFVADHPWVAEAGLFRALKAAHDGAPWWSWPAPLRDRADEALTAARAEHADAVARWTAIAWFFEDAWRDLHAYAASRGVEILGDLPIYVGHDSVDVWCDPHLFQLRPDGTAEAVAGVPADAFSETGQRWGNPLFDWDAHAADGHAWWAARLRRCLALTDHLRLDHFIAFVRYYAIPADQPDARGGAWRPGPGKALFDDLAARLPRLPLVVEDLGDVGPDVVELQETLGYPGMRVLQFGADGDPGNPHAPANHPEEAVAYLGTHDNDTTLGWWNTLDPGTRARLRDTFPARDGHPTEQMLATLWRTCAAWAITTPQDLLGLGSEARMNTPGTVVGNWTWRLRPGQLDEGIARGLRAALAATGRLPPGATP